MTRADLTLRAAIESDLAAIASVHLAAYSRRHFTSRLKREALIDYYRLFLSGGAKTLVLVRHGETAENEDILGFVVFGQGIAEKIALFKKRNAVDILMASAANPITAGSKVLQRLWTRIAHGRATASTDYLLLSIAVAMPGTGAGGRLLDAFLDHATSSGVERVGLYVNADNLTAINAYTTRGFLFRELHGGQFYMECVLPRTV